MDVETEQGSVGGPGRRRIYQRDGARTGPPKAPRATPRTSREKPPAASGRAPGPLASRVVHEAHLPAQEAQARTHTRLSPAHADEGRPADAEAPPRQGPQAPHGLTPGMAQPASRTI